MSDDLKKELAEIAVWEEDYPGQNAEIRRIAIVAAAVREADEILMDNSDGSVEELDYLTAEVAFRFFEKVRARTVSNLLAVDIRARMREGG